MAANGGIGQTGRHIGLYNPSFLHFCLFSGKMAANGGHWSNDSGRTQSWWRLGLVVCAEVWLCCMYEPLHVFMYACMYVCKYVRVNMFACLSRIRAYRTYIHTIHIHTTHLCIHTYIHDIHAYIHLRTKTYTHKQISSFCVTTGPRLTVHTTRIFGSNRKNPNGF